MGDEGGKVMEFNGLSFPLPYITQQNSHLV